MDNGRVASESRDTEGTTSYIGEMEYDDEEDTVMTDGSGNYDHINLHSFNHNSKENYNMEVEEYELNCNSNMCVMNNQYEYDNEDECNTNRIRHNITPIDFGSMMDEEIDDVDDNYDSYNNEVGEERQMKIVLLKKNIVNSGVPSYTNTNIQCSRTWIDTCSSSNNGEVMYQCLFGTCQLTTTDHNVLCLHLAAHAEVQYESCPPSIHFIPCLVTNCDRTFNKNKINEMYSHLSMHAYLAKGQARGWLALRNKEECQNIEKCGYSYKLHLTHNGQAVVCEWDSCQEVYTDLIEFFSHCRNHIDFIEKEDNEGIGIQCQWLGCQRKCRTKSHLRVHLRVHTGEKIVGCPFCGEVFSGLSRIYDHVLRRNIVSYTGEPLTCQFCKKKFTNAKNLRLHCNNHLMSHKCLICGVLFAFNRDLVRHHKIMHTQSRHEFGCTQCGKTFTSNTLLIQHIKLHNLPEHKCPMCFTVFKWGKQLKKHIEEVHSENGREKYICHLCEEEKGYLDGSSLTRHLKKVHECIVPQGFSRFQYKKCQDGYMRLQIKRIMKPS